MVTKSMLFTGLLVSSFVTVIHIKGSEPEPEPGSIADERNRDFFDSDPEDEPDQPTGRKRYLIIQKALDRLGASADEPLKEIITNLTLGFDEATIIDLITDMFIESPTKTIDHDVCIEKLTEVIQKHEKKYTAALKIKRLAKMILKNSVPIQKNENPEATVPQQAMSPAQESESPEVAVPQKPLSRNIPKYPLLADVFHPDKEFFVEATKQLKAGEFSRDFPKGVLFYGPPGVGKNEMINALVNESGCLIFSIGATELVGKFQGSGAAAIASIFNQAKTADFSKGVIVLVDELQSLTPLTNDKKVQVAHTRSGQDYDNALTQLWLEYDRCLNNHNNIMIIGTCNEFHRIDERIRGRFECIEFFYPDEDGTYEILKNKAKYFDVPFSEEELQNCTKKAHGLSGRDLTKFMKNVKQDLRRKKGNKEAIKLALEKQSKTTDDAKENSNSKLNFKDEALQGLRSTVHGVGNAVGTGIVTGIFKVFSFGIKYFSDKD